MKCFYHSVDFDGKCSGAIIKRAFPQCKVVGIDHGDPFPWDSIDHKEAVYMVDFSLPVGDMVVLANRCNLVWIDHHYGAIEQASKAKFHPAGLRRVGQGACELCWEFLYSGFKMPDAVWLLGRYDNLDLGASENVLYFQRGLLAVSEDGMKPEASRWTSLLDNEPEAVNCVISIGQIVSKALELQDKEYAQKYAFETTLEGMPAIAINKGITSSLLFSSVWDSEKYHIMCTFVRRSDGQWDIRIYTPRNDIDLSEVARKHGGGGHRQAAGWSTDICPFQTT